jgi:DnaJ-domain-containing protein 1
MFYIFFFSYLHNTISPVCQILNEQLAAAAPLEPSGKECSSYISCDKCVASRCAWCISQRACREDQAWICQGDTDHIGLGGVGKHTACPSPEEHLRAAAERAQRKESIRLSEEQGASKNTNYCSSAHCSEAEQSSNQGQDDDAHIVELNRRAMLGRENPHYGEQFPYQTLVLTQSASTAQIKKAYRQLSLRFHPDKNVDHVEKARVAFEQIAAAFDILGNAEKRAIFDDMGSGEHAEAFQSEEAYQRYGKKNENNFYQGHRLITPLTEGLWEKRLGSGNTVWLVEFYAPWF